MAKIESFRYSLLPSTVRMAKMARLANFCHHCQINTNGEIPVFFTNFDGMEINL
jgi:hypothetical protein